MTGRGRAGCVAGTGTVSGGVLGGRERGCRAQIPNSQHGLQGQRRRHRKSREIALLTKLVGTGLKVCRCGSAFGVCGLLSRAGNVCGLPSLTLPVQARRLLRLRPTGASTGPQIRTASAGLASPSPSDASTTHRMSPSLPPASSWAGRDRQQGGGNGLLEDRKLLRDAALKRQAASALASPPLRARPRLV